MSEATPARESAGGMWTTPSMSSAFVTSGIVSQRRSNSVRVSRSPWRSGGMATVGTRTSVSI